MPEIPRNYAEGGIVDNAVNYWNDVARSQDAKVKSGERSPFVAGAAKFGAKVMNGLISISGLHEVEKSSGKLGWDVGSGADGATIAKDSAKLAFDGTMSALTFLPAGKVVSGLAKGERAYQTAKAGTAVAGMTLKAGAGEAAGVAEQLSGAVARNIPKTGTVTKEATQALLGDLQGIGKKYGIEIAEGGTVGESVGTMNKIAVNTKVGGPHEITHVVQQLQTRATALEAQAGKLGKPVGQLTAAERQSAFETMVKPFEEVAYNQHEMFAKSATNFGGSAKATYGEAIQGNIQSWQQALSHGQVPAANVDAVARGYGQLPNAVGRSQGEIARNMRAIGAAEVNYTRENMNQ